MFHVEHLLHFYFSFFFFFFCTNWKCPEKQLLTSVLSVLKSGDKTVFEWETSRIQYVRNIYANFFIRFCTSDHSYRTKTETKWSFPTEEHCSHSLTGWDQGSGGSGEIKQTQTKELGKKTTTPKPRRWPDQANHSPKAGGPAVRPRQPSVSLHTEVTDRLLLSTWQISPHTFLRILWLYISPVKKKEKKENEILELHLPE